MFVFKKIMIVCARKYIEKELCICYNAKRQKVIAFQYERRNESPNRSSVQSGDSSFLFILAKYPVGYSLSL